LDVCATFLFNIIDFKHPHFTTSTQQYSTYKYEDITSEKFQNENKSNKHERKIGIIFLYHLTSSSTSLYLKENEKRQESKKTGGKKRNRRKRFHHSTSGFVIKKPRIIIATQINQQRSFKLIAAIVFENATEPSTNNKTKPDVRSQHILF